MFAPRSSTLPSSSTSNVMRPLVSNENTMNTVSSAKQSSTFSTPGAKTKRRAFGDISNKKSLSSATKPGSGFGNSNNIVLKKQAFTPRSKVQQKPLLPKSTSKPQQQQQSQRNPTSVRKPFSSTSINVDPTSITKKPSIKAVLPRSTSAATNAGKTKTVVFEPVDDVEWPAGRLFSQQIENEDDDDISEDSDQKFIKNFWSEHKASIPKMYEEECRMSDEELERKVQLHMGDFLRMEKAEEMKGIDSLADLVDDWNLDPDLPLDHDDDSWNQSTSLLFEDDILNDSLLL